MQKKILSNEKHRIKILHIMSPGSGNFGGIESFLINIINLLIITLLNLILFFAVIIP